MMMKLGGTGTGTGTRVQPGRTLLEPQPQPKFHFKHFTEKQRKVFEVNRIVCSALHSEFKLLETTKIKQVEEEEEEKRNGNHSHPRDFQQRKPRCLCLHGFRTNGDILKKQIQRWPESVHNKIDFVFVDAPFPAEGKSDVEGIYDPPFYEWFQFTEDYMKYRNFYECLAYIENCMLHHGPIDGVLGFSLGAFLAAALPGLQASGVALTKVPKLKFQILIAGGKIPAPTVAEKAFSSPIECPTLHIIGDTDLIMKANSIKLLESFLDPFVIRHKRGHIVPRLDEKALAIMLKFLDKIQCNLSSCNGLNTSPGTAEMRESYME